MQNELQLWFVRHGETVANAAGRIAGWTNSPLSANGREQATTLRDSLENNQFDSVWTSDLDRAIETAFIAYGKANIDQRLREMYFGELEDVPFDAAPQELIDNLFEFEAFAPPSGETLTQFFRRINQFLNNLNSGKHLIFTHGGVIRMVTKHLGHDHFVPNCAVVKVDWHQKKLIGITNCPDGVQTLVSSLSNVVA